MRFKTLRSSLTLLKKEGIEPFKVPLFKGDLEGSLQNKSTNQKVLKHALNPRSLWSFFMMLNFNHHMNITSGVEITLHFNF